MNSGPSADGSTTFVTGGAGKARTGLCGRKSSGRAEWIGKAEGGALGGIGFGGGGAAASSAVVHSAPTTTSAIAWYGVNRLGDTQVRSMKSAGRG